MAQQPKTVRHFLTAQGTQDRLAEKSAPVFGLAGSSGEPNLPAIFVNPEKQFQTILGIGGAFTEAAAVTLSRLSKKNQQRVLEAYFGHDGHGYSLCRTHIQSCDFSLGNYTYVPTPGDTQLKSFTIDRDRKALLPMIREAMRVAGRPITLFASPWSPPAWMKTTGQMNGGGKLKPEFRQAWADCFVRYIQEYQREGVAIWGLTVQNEPEAAMRWDSCLWTAQEERDFVRDYLGPTLERAGLGDVKIIIWDHNRDQMVRRASVAYSDPKASAYIWGTGFHWYAGDIFDNVRLHHDAWPDKHLLFTEGCQEFGTHFRSWAPGERYARSMIMDFNRWAEGWVDWNLLLDLAGGPNHVDNMCSAPILADTQNDRVHLQSSYYYIGHFARFIRPGAKRVLCSCTRDDIEATAFQNPDRTVAVIVLNRTDEKKNLLLHVGDSEALIQAPGHSISTYEIA